MIPSILLNLCKEWRVLPMNDNVLLTTGERHQAAVSTAPCDTPSLWQYLFLLLNRPCLSCDKKPPIAKNSRFKEGRRDGDNLSG